MAKKASFLWIVFPMFSISLISISGPSHGVDGVVEINQVRALAGNVTPGDTPGFPVSLTQKGSYKLTSNLTIPNENTSGIIATAENVSIDLNGFSVIGVSGAAGPSGFGIGVRTEARGVVYNGMIRGMGDTGVQVGRFSRVEHVQVSLNGIGVQAAGSLIREVVATENRLEGIRIANRSTVTECIANDNLGSGIVGDIDVNIVGNTVMENHGMGIVAGGSGLVLQNTVSGNGGLGLSLGSETGYGQNVVNSNNGSPLNPQVSGGIQVGVNICGGETSCP